MIQQVIRKLIVSSLEESDLFHLKLTGQQWSVIKDNEKVYVMEGHIILWLLRREPIRTSVTHPSVFTKEYLLKFIPGAKDTSIRELETIMNTEPAYIVKPQVSWYLKSKPDLLNILDDWIKDYYEPVFSVGLFTTYKRK